MSILVDDPYDILAAPDVYTAEHWKEVVARPFGFADELTPEQFATRISFAKVTIKAILKACRDELPPWAGLYLKYPPFLFYTNANGNRAKYRIVSWSCRKDDGKVVGQSIAANAVCNRVMDVAPDEDLVPMTAWSQDHVNTLRSGLISTPGLFLDPLGFLLVRFAQ
jgi:hypothetical protein